MPTREIAIQMTLDAGQTVSELDLVQKEVKETGDGFENLDESTQKLSKSTKGFLKEQRELAEAAKVVKTQLEGVEDSIRNVDKASADAKAAENFAKLNKIVDENVLSIQELGTAADNYKNIALVAGKTTPIGKEALQKAAELEKQMDLVNREVTQLAEGGRKLNTALQLGTGVVAGFAAFQGVTAALGVEEEELQEALVKVQGAQAALMGIKELSIVLDRKGLVITAATTIATKALAAAQQAYTIVVGGTSGALKIFRLALIATGIGAIVVGIGLLIANFDAVVGFVGKAIKSFKSLGVAIRILLLPITFLLEAWLFFFGEVEEGFSAQVQAQKKANEEAEKLHKERIKQLKEERQAQIDLLEEIQKRGKIQKEVDDLAILQARARGASETEVFNLQVKQNEIKLEMAQAELAAKEEIIRINHEMAQAEFDRLKAFLQTQALQNGFTEKQRDRDLERLEQAKKDFLEKEKAELGASRRTVATLEANNKIFIRKRRERNKNAVKDEISDEEKLRQKQAEDQLKANQKNADDLFKQKISIRDRLNKADRDRGKTDLQIRIDELKAQFQSEKELIKDHDDLKIQLQREFNEQMSILRGEVAEVEKATAEAEKAETEEKLQEQLDIAQGDLDQAKGTLEAMNEINNLLNQIGDERRERNNADRDEELSNINEQKKKELSVEGLSARQKAIIEKRFAEQEFKVKVATAKANDKIAEKQFKRDKGLKIAMAAINTAAAIMQALGSFPPPASFIFAGLAAITGVAQIVAIARTKFKASASSISPPNIAIPSADAGGDGGAGGAGGDGGDGGAQTDVTTDIDELLDKPVTVSITEVQEVDKTVSQMDDIATIG